MPAMLAEHAKGTVSQELQFATFYVGDILLGVEICQVQEINRQAAVTPVPHAPAYVRGVINLRGEVTTVVDLRTILGLPPAVVTRDSRNLIVNTQGESIGFLVDKISDILSLRSEQITPPPSNINGIQSRFFSGVHALESGIVVLLDVEEALSQAQV